MSHHFPNKSIRSRHPSTPPKPKIYITLANVSSYIRIRHPMIKTTLKIMIKGKCNEESSYSFQGHFHSKYAIWRIYVMLRTHVNIRIMRR